MRYAREKLREEFIRLLEEDKEFRYTVWGYLGVREIIERMDKLEQQMAENTSAIRELQEEVRNMQKQVEKHSRAIVDLQKQVEKHSRTIVDLQKRMEEHSRAIKNLQKQVEEHSRAIRENTKAIRELQKQVEEHSREIRELQKQVQQHTKAIIELQRQVEEHSKAIKNMQKQIEEHSRVLMEHSKAIREHTEAIKELQKQVEKHSRIIAEHSKAIKEHSEAIRSLQKQIEKHTSAIEILVREQERLSRRIDALGARWGLIAEETFKQALEKFLKEYFKVAEIEKVIIVDEEGYVYGIPSQIEYDIIVRNNIHHIVEVKSSTTRGDIAAFHRKTILYEKKRKVKTRKIVVTCYIDEKARKLAQKLGIEIIKY